MRQADDGGHNGVVSALLLGGGNANGKRRRPGEILATDEGQRRRYYIDDVRRTVQFSANIRCLNGYPVRCGGASESSLQNRCADDLYHLLQDSERVLPERNIADQHQTEVPIGSE